MQRALVKEGFRYLSLAGKKMKDKVGNVTKRIPYKYYEHVYSELCNFDDSKEPIKHRIVEGQHQQMSVDTSLQDPVLHDADDEQCMKVFIAQRAQLAPSSINKSMR